MDDGTNNKEQRTTMSAFTVTILQAITIGISLALSYFFNKASLKLWRVYVGFLFGFTVSWLAGVIIWSLVFMSSDPYAAIVAGMPKSFLFAVVGGGMGAYFGRRNAKLQIPNPAVNTADVR
jgi:hypothetical protein